MQGEIFSARPVVADYMAGEPVGQVGAECELAVGFGLLVEVGLAFVVFADGRDARIACGRSPGLTLAESRQPVV